MKFLQKLAHLQSASGHLEITIIHHQPHLTMQAFTNDASTAEPKTHGAYLRGPDSSVIHKVFLISSVLNLMVEQKSYYNYDTRGRPGSAKMPYATSTPDLNEWITKLL